MTSVFAQLRRQYHEQLCDGVLGYRVRGESRHITAGDKDSVPSTDLANGMAERIGIPLRPIDASPQTLGSRFEAATCSFLDAAFARLKHLRPGQWDFSTDDSGNGVADFEQYDYIEEIVRLTEADPRLHTALGGGYLITPDIVIARRPASDEELNANEKLLDNAVATRSPLRGSLSAGQRRILHASVSCKFTLRSDRAQNVRTEALNLIRNRKGQTPRIVLVTMEPLPGRLASIAYGTGDVDCTYHSALDELLAAAEASRHEDATELLTTLLDGKRLRDIADLPLDLAT